MIQTVTGGHAIDATTTGTPYSVGISGNVMLNTLNLLGGDEIGTNLCDGTTNCSPPSPCPGGSTEQSFGFQGMKGCSGTVSFPNRDSLCLNDYHVCSAQEYIDKRAFFDTPDFHYWTDDELRFNGTGPGDCWVHETVGSPCAVASGPMLVCAGSGADGLGNICTWDDCGYHSASPSIDFGGCGTTNTAGVLCCP